MKIEEEKETLNVESLSQFYSLNFSWSILSRRRSVARVGRLLWSVAAKLRPLLVLHAGEADAVHQVLCLHHLAPVGVRSEVWAVPAMTDGSLVISRRWCDVRQVFSQVLQSSLSSVNRIITIIYRKNNMIVWRGSDITGIISNRNH